MGHMDERGSTDAFDAVRVEAANIDLVSVVGEAELPDVTTSTGSDTSAIERTLTDLPDDSLWGDEALHADRPGSPPLRQLLAAVDLIAVATGWAIVVFVTFLVDGSAPTVLTGTVQAAFILGAGALLLSAAGLYRRRICAVRAAEVSRTARVSLGLGLTAAVLFVGDGRDVALLAGALGTAVWFTLLSAERGLFREWIHARRAVGDFGAPVVVVGGNGSSAAATARFLEENPVLGFEVRGLVCPADESVEEPAPMLLQGTDRLSEHVRRLRASGVVFDANSLTGDELNDLVQQVSPLGVHVHISSGLRGVDRRRITVSPLADETFLYIAPLGLSRRQVVAKRLMDIVLSTLILIAVSPVLAVSAFLVWAYDRGPVLFRQERVGMGGEPFTVYKLRTMVVDAEARKAELMASNGRSGPLFKLERDPRVTPFGRFLRASSIDEIPQLLNVLEGTMSLVGPRPALPSEAAQFDERLNARLTVKPGVTGLWQVEARDLANFDLYRRFDLLYVKNWSLGFDLSIVARTATVVGLRALSAFLPARFKRANALE